ncbi:MAG: hypothetical protein AB1421_13945 [Pseudomonadota bacterium]
MHPTSAVTPQSHPASRAKVSKKLHTGQPGTQRYLAQYGESLLCVRYRQSGDGKRYTTVELLVEERVRLPQTRNVTLAPNALVAVKIDYPQSELRTRAKASGARWDATRKAWIMPMTTAHELGLTERIIGVVQ